MKKIFLVLTLCFIASTLYAGVQQFHMMIIGQEQAAGGGGGGGTVSFGDGAGDSEWASDAAAWEYVIVDKPASTVEGDLLIVSILDDTAQVITYPDWILIQQVDSSSSRLTVAYKIAGGSEPSDYTFTGGVPSQKTGIIARYTKDSGTWAIEASSEKGETAVTTITSNSVTASQSNAMLHIAWGNDEANSVTTPPTSMTEIANVVDLASCRGAAWCESRSAGAITKSVGVGSSSDMTIIAVMIEAQ